MVDLDPQQPHHKFPIYLVIYLHYILCGPSKLAEFGAFFALQNFFLILNLFIPLLNAFKVPLRKKKSPVFRKYFYVKIQRQET